MSDFWSGGSRASTGAFGGAGAHGSASGGGSSATDGAARLPSTSSEWSAEWFGDTAAGGAAPGAVGMGELEAQAEDDGGGGIPAEVLDRVGFVFDHDGGYSYEITPQGHFEIVTAPGGRGIGCVLTPTGEFASAWQTLADYVVDMGPVAPGPSPDPGGDPAGPAPGPGRGPTRNPGGGRPGRGGPRAPDEDASPPWDGPGPGGEPDAPRSGRPVGGDLGELMAQERLSPEEIDRARELIDELPRDEQADLYLDLQDKVEYSNQRDNASPLEEADGGTCGLTAVAMALKALGVPNPKPEMQYEDALLVMAAGRDITAYATWAYVAEELGVTSTEIGSGVLTRAQWENIRDEHLAAGKGVVMSLRGHVVRLQGVNERGLIVDDPYGASTLAEETRRDRGSTDDIYNWTDTNDASGDGPMAGEDLGYPWEDVVTYQFGSIFSFDG